MPWKESRIVDQRLQFLSSYQKEEMSVSEPCREFGVLRPTGYRWINRYNESGLEGLLNLSSKGLAYFTVRKYAIMSARSCTFGTLKPIEDCGTIASLSRIQRSIVTLSQTTPELLRAVE